MPTTNFPDRPPRQMRLALVSDPSRVLGIDLTGDIVVGRGSQGVNRPDVDLTPFGAREKGVSRRHALVRPTRSQLFVIDLESTNGTYVNAIPVARGMAQVIRNGDKLTLGGLQFVVRIIERPAGGASGMAQSPSPPPSLPPSLLPSPVIPGGPSPAGVAYAEPHFDPDPDPTPLDADGRSRRLPEED